MSNSKQVFEHFAIGDRLEYLGLVMVVTKRIEHREAGVICGLRIKEQPPELWADYVDRHGIIRTHKFIGEDAMGAISW